MYAALAGFGIFICCGWWKLSGRTFDSSFYKLVGGFWGGLFAVGCVLAFSRS